MCHQSRPRRSFRYTKLWNRLNRTMTNYFSRVQTRGFEHTLGMNILTCTQLKLDDSAEFQIVPTIKNN
jgi:hypothetical protein